MRDVHISDSLDERGDPSPGNIVTGFNNQEYSNRLENTLLMKVSLLWGLSGEQCVSWLTATIHLYAALPATRGTRVAHMPLMCGHQEPE